MTDYLSRMTDDLSRMIVHLSRMIVHLSRMIAHLSRMDGHSPPASARLGRKRPILGRRGARPRPPTRWA
jgi:hypothetical protein